MHLRLITLGAALAISMAAAPPVSAPPSAVDVPFQVRYVANLNLANSQIFITNSGASGADVFSGTTASITGSICANVYAFNAQEELLSCCSCPVTPNGLVKVSVQQDILPNLLTPETPNSMVIKLVASAPIASGPTATCAQSDILAGSASSLLLPGMLAWGTTTHTGAAGLSSTETPFSPSTLSTGELTRLTTLCRFITANGSGHGICNSCPVITGGVG